MTGQYIDALDRGCQKPGCWATFTASEAESHECAPDAPLRDAEVVVGWIPRSLAHRYADELVERPRIERPREVMGVELGSVADAGTILAGILWILGFAIGAWSASGAFVPGVTWGSAAVMAGVVIEWWSHRFAERSA